MKFEEMTDKLVEATHTRKKKKTNIVNNLENKLQTLYGYWQVARTDSRISGTSLILVQFS